MSPHTDRTAAPARAMATPRRDPAASSSSPGGIHPEALAPSVVGRLLAILRREPVLFVTLAYILVSFLGIWSSYWFYRGLGLPILDYLQGSDLFIAGLRRPDYALLLAAPLAVLWVSALPLAWAERNPARTEALRARRWWGRWLFPERRSWLGLWGIRSDTLLAISMLGLSMYMLYSRNEALAERIVAGAPHGQQVRLTLAGAAEPLPGQAQLLGTTSAFVLVWWTRPGRIEALPTANIARIESASAPVAAAAVTATVATPPATTPASAPAAIPASKTP